VVAVPRVVALRRGDHPAGVGQPGDAVMLELAGCEVARGEGSVGGHDVDVLGSIGDPVLAIQAAEESFDLPWCLPRRILGPVALVARSAGERDPPTVGRPSDVAEPVGHRAHGAYLAGPVDREDVQRRVALLLAAPRGEGEKATIRRPGRVGVVVAGTHGCIVEPDTRNRRVLREVDGRHDERNACAVGRHGWLPDTAASVDESFRDRAMPRRCLSHFADRTPGSSVVVAHARSTAAIRRGRRVDRRRSGPGIRTCRSRRDPRTRRS